MENKAVFQVSVDSRAIYHVLVSTQIGETIPYSKLQAVIGRNIEDAKGSLYTAQRIALRENQMVFSTVRGVGLKRLSNSEIASLPESTITKIRRAARREISRQRVVVEADLTNSERIVRNTKVSLLGAIHAFSTNNTSERLLASRPYQILDVGEVVQLFSTVPLREERRNRPSTQSLVDQIGL